MLFFWNIILRCFNNNIHNNTNNNNYYYNKCFWAANQNIRMISEGSCDWSNDGKKKALKSQE